MFVPTQEERDAFVWMQGRMVDLLMHHNAHLFDHLFTERIAEREQLREEILARYRDLAVLFYLRDDLFGSILPRIKRRLSFEAPREVRIEEPPTRGRIDWSCTAAASWRDRPGEVPLQVHTRQRRRHFTTPENLLTVVTLLEYRHAVQSLLDEEATRNSSRALLHPLNEIVEACTRELSFPQFAGLVGDCQQILAGYAEQTAEELEERVADRLIPGRNSAYDDLLRWRHRLRELRLLDRIRDVDLHAMPGSDPQRDNYLYQLWLFYEWGESLQQKGVLEEWDHKSMALTFAWGKGEEQRRYRLQHDKNIAESQQWGGLRRVPGVRPDFYLSHVEPVEARDPRKKKDNLIWREAGFVLDAKYYRPRENDDKAPASPIKRMLADLQLTGEKHGALLFAFHGDPTAAVPAPNGADEDETIRSRNAPPTLRPVPERAQRVAPDLRVELWRFQPRPIAVTHLHQQFEVLLNHVHGLLKQRAVLRCHGFFLDELSVTAHGALADVVGIAARDGDALADHPEKLLVCPKPHIAPWRVDLVRHAQCCADPTVCHVIGQPGVEPPERLVRLEQVHEAIRSAGIAAGDDNDAVVEAATQQVLVVAKRYADLVQPNLLDYRHQMREMLAIGELFDQTPLLTEAQRDTLALGKFLWEQIHHIKASNYAGPTLLFTGVLEEVNRAAVFSLSGPLYKSNGRQKLPDTLGTIGNSKNYGGSNYELLVETVVLAGHWQERIAGKQQLLFSDWIDMHLEISEIRNQAAHTAYVAMPQFYTLCRLLFGDVSSGYGALNGVLLARRSHSSDAR